MKNSGLALLLTAILSGCVTVQQPEQNGQMAQLANLQLPEYLTNAADYNQSYLQQPWLTQFDDKSLNNLVITGLKQSYSLKQQYLTLAIKKQQMKINDAVFWPELSASLSQSRRKLSSSSDASNSASASLDLSYELDLWGKLSDQSKQANYDWLSEQANYQQNRLRFIADVVNAWVSVKTAAQQLTLSQKRAANTQQNLDIIESSYNKGLTNANDVYLTRNALNSAKAQVTQNQQNLLVAKRQLQNLIGEYPDAQVDFNSQFPTHLASPKLPKVVDLINNQGQLKSAWLNLLSKNAALAYSHKQRFPSLRFSASISDNKTNIGNLLSSGGLAWSLLGSVSAPIFQGGKLKATEEIAKLSVAQSEQAYLATVSNLMQQILNSLTKEQSLQDQLEFQLQAEKNAKAAYQLSFEQYQQGLISYTSVLDAQNRWFDAQTALIQLQSEQIQNRVNLYVALGIDASPDLK